MRDSIVGGKYAFDVVSDGEMFHIEAVHLQSLRCSCINNLNPILSHLGVDPEDRRYEDSSWVVSAEQCQRFYYKAVAFLSDAGFRQYVEAILDEDRALGEWESQLGSASTPH